MRCARCGRDRSSLRTRRGPHGRLVFDWCEDCLARAELQSLAIGFVEADEPPPPDLDPGADEPRRAPVRALPARERTLALLTIGLVMVAWGLVLETVAIAGLAGFRGRDDGFGPAMTNRLAIFAISGAILAVVGLGIGLAAVDGRTRSRWLARASEVVAAGAGLAILVVGIVDHRPRRGGWIVLALAVAALAAWLARRWSRSIARTPRIGPR